MKTAVGWIFLMFLLVDAKPSNPTNPKQLLEQIYSTAQDLLKDSQYINSTYVDVVFDRTKCECKDFCIAQKILSQALHLKKHDKLSRALLVYTNMRKCDYTASGVIYPLRYLTMDVIHCVQQHLSHPKIQC